MTECAGWVIVSGVAGVLAGAGLLLVIIRAAMPDDPPDGTFVE